MKKEMIVRAWKDPEFRARLSTDERASLPESPCGKSLSELDEAELSSIFGGVLAPRDVTGMLRPSTGCTDARPTCGYINCTTIRAGGVSI